MDFRLIDDNGEEFGTLANVDVMDDETLLTECKRIIAEAREAMEDEG